MQNTYCANRFGGWTNEGLIWFNALYAEVKADREKNDGVVEQNYKNLCLSTMVTPKNMAKMYG